MKKLKSRKYKNDDVAAEKFHVTYQNNIVFVYVANTF